VAWFRSSPLNVPDRGFDPSQLEFPFRFPVLVVTDDGTVDAHRGPDGLVAVPERLVRSGSVPATRVVDLDFRTWCPAQILSIFDSGRTLLGQRIFFAEFRWTEGPRTDLETVRAAVRRAIERDPDDLWNQTSSRRALIEKTTRANTFSEIVRVIVGQGDEDT
jgi:hypothetical protein